MHARIVICYSPMMAHLRRRMAYQRAIPRECSSPPCPTRWSLLACAHQCLELWRSSMPMKVNLQNMRLEGFVHDVMKRRVSPEQITHPMTVVELEEEAQESVGNLTAERLLEVDLVSIDHLARILCSPWQDDECQMIFNHRDHGMRDVSLFLAQSSIDVLLELLCELLDDGGRVADLLTIQFNEGQLSFFGMKFEFVVDILRWCMELWCCFI